MRDIICPTLPKIERAPVRVNYCPARSRGIRAMVADRRRIMFLRTRRRDIESAIERLREYLETECIRESPKTMHCKNTRS